MNVLILYSHPNEKSFNHAIKETVQKQLLELGHKVEVRDLYKMKFNPIVSVEDFKKLASGTVADDVKKEQDFVAKSDILLFVFPIWWAGFPAEIKGYIDRVFTNGFAYKYNKQGGVDQLLKDKKAILFNTTGTPSDIYEQSGIAPSIRKIISDGVLGFFGTKVIEHKFFGNVVGTTDENRHEMLKEVQETIKKHF